MHIIIEKTTKRSIKNIIMIVFIYHNVICCNTIDVLYKLTTDSKYRIDSFARRQFELWPNRS